MKLKNWKIFQFYINNMGNDFFRFKQFIVKQSGAAMKVGVDSVLLGAWACAEKACHVLDVGSGSGVLALMMAQRYPDAMIDAVEIDNDAHLQAIENVRNSAWSNRIQLFNDDFFNYVNNYLLRYDMIISNPPYFTDSLKSSDTKRTIARHNDSLPHTQLMSESAKLLTSDGILALTLPPTEASVLINEASSCNLFVKRVIHVKSLPSKPVYRMLLEFSKAEYPQNEQTLCIEKTDRSDYTEEYKQLTQNFYIKF